MLHLGFAIMVTPARDTLVSKEPDGRLRRKSHPHHLPVFAYVATTYII
jgi:hypothetical protein